MSELLSFNPLPAPSHTAPAPGAVTAGDPRQQIFNVLSTPDGRFHVGEWRSSQGAWRVHYTEYELCHLLEGVVRLTDEQGRMQEYRAGDSFVIASGFRGLWEVIEPCRKLYAIYE